MSYSKENKSSNTTCNVKKLVSSEREGERNGREKSMLGDYAPVNQYPNQPYLPFIPFISFGSARNTTLELSGNDREARKKEGKMLDASTTSLITNSACGILHAVATGR
jgi:hypothetical protein